MLKNNESIFITVILSVYNAELYLSDTIQSILDQTHKNFEFIIVNDGSCDKSVDIIKSFMRKDNRIQLIDRDNKGVVYSLNEAISKSKGKYIAKIDHDDLAYNNRLEVQVQAMEDRKLDICGGHYNTINEDGTLLNYHLVPISHQLCVISLASKVPFAHPSVMMRNSFILEHQLKYGNGPSIISEDLDMWNDFYNSGAIFGNVDELVIQYRILQNSISRLGHKTIQKETKVVLKKFLMENKSTLYQLLINLPEKLNDEEQSLIARLVFKLFKRDANFFLFKKLSKINKKIIFCIFIASFKI